LVEFCTEPREVKSKLQKKSCFAVAYKESGQDYYDQQYRDRAIKNLQKRAAEFGLSLVGVT